MSRRFVPFDMIRKQVDGLVRNLPHSLSSACRIYIVRDLLGRIRLSVSASAEENAACCELLNLLARGFHETLGPHAYPPASAVLFVDDAVLDSLSDKSHEMKKGVFWVDRLVTGSNWWTVGHSCPRRKPARYTLYSVKGGVGRSTTGAVLAWHLARNGHDVLVVDLDLESPSLSSSMLSPLARPDFGVTDWFVEDLVGQGDEVVLGIVAAPSWAQDLDGEVYVAPAHGRDAGEYLAKLGRVYMETDLSWTRRLDRLLSRLEETYHPSVVLLESRSGLHDISAATVTDLGAEILLFAVDAESHWTDYGLLFRHWQAHNLAPAIRQRLSIISALTPETGTEAYLDQFREQAWNLFREHLYDDVDPTGDPHDSFSFDLREEGAPHDPVAIHWNRGLASGASLRDLDAQRTPISQAYFQFLTWFDDQIKVDRE